MIPLSNEVTARIAAEDPENGDVQPTSALSPKQTRREYLRGWRSSNRERLREYGRNWKAGHPDRVKIHRERKYAERRRRRCRLRLRRAAQRHRRALQHSILRRNTF